MNRNIATPIIIIFSALFLNSPVYSQDWQSQFNCVAANNSNTIGAKLSFIGNTPYLAFQDSDLGYRVSVMKRNDPAANYVVVGSQGFSAGMASHITTAVAGNELYVAYRDGGYAGKATVMKFNGTAWVAVGIPGFSAGAVEFTTLSFIGTTPYLCFKDSANGGKATVMSFNGSNWVSVGPAGFTASAVDQIEMKSEGSNLYVAYCDVLNSNKISVKKWNGTSWVTVGVEAFSTGLAQNPHLAFDATTPYVSFSDGTLSNKASVMKFDGTAWINVGEAGFTPGAALDPQLAIINGTACVVYGDVSNCGFQNQGRRLSAKKFNGAQWVDYGSSCFTDSSYNVYNTLYSFLFNNGTAYVLYSDLCIGLDTKLSMHANNATLDAHTAELKKATVSPNPFTGRFVINGLTENEYEYQVVNVVGETIAEGYVTRDNAALNLAMLNKGVYFLRLTGEAGLQTVKIMKQ